MPRAASLADPLHPAALDPPGGAGDAPVPAFDRLTALACRCLGAPVSLVTFVDEQRQTLRSQHGLPEPWASRRETPLPHAFVQHVVQSGHLVAVEDARAHPVLRGTLATGDLRVAACLGAPIRHPDGQVLGALCAIDTAPRAWTADERDLLGELAAIAEGEVARQDDLARRVHAEARFHHVAELVPQLLWTASADGRLDYVNERWATFTGGTLDAVQADWGAFIHPDDAASVATAWAASVEAGTPYESKYRLRGADGAYRWFLMRAEALRGPHGEVLQWFGSCTDIHDAHEARSQLLLSAERLRLIHRATTDIVWDLDVAAGTLDWSPAIAEVMGWHEATLGTALDWWMARIHPGDRARVSASFRTTVASAGDTWQEQYRFERADGTYAYVMDRGYLVRGDRGEVVRVVGALVDLSERKAFEAQLVDAREAAETAARLKSSLLANMSHEIRTPLTAILGYAEVLADEAAAGAASANVRDYAVTIERAGHRLLDTLNSVLDLAQIESGQMRVSTEPVDLLEEARAVCAALQPLADAKGLALRVDGTPTWARADRAAVGRVLNNLVGNAIKFTARGHVALRVGAEGGVATVCVADTGPGMAPTFLPHVFGEFQQESEGYHRSHEGNGLGLAITKALVGLMEGAIEVESARGAGSAFTVRLPRAEAVPPDPAPAGTCLAAA